MELRIPQEKIVCEAVGHPFDAKKPVFLRELSLVGIDVIVEARPLKVAKFCVTKNDIK